MGWRDKLDELAKKQLFNRVFDSYDKDNSGFIQANEVAGFLTLILKQVGVEKEIGGTQAGYALKAIDKDKDGKLSKDQLYDVYKMFVENFQKITGSKQ